MRKILLILVIIFSFIQVNATHIMGGEITWRCIKDPANPNVGQYIFSMKLYRDCEGLGTLSTISYPLSVWFHPTVTQITVNWVSNTDISPPCNSITSGNPQLDCYGPTPAGAVEEYIYESQPISLPGNPPANGWHFTWDSCCRNGAISNLVLSSPTNPSEGFTLRAAMYPYTDPITGLVVPADPCFDSSPVFNESPKTIICAGYPFAYSHNASDPELDSIRYYWAEPLDDFAGNYDPDPAMGSPAAIPFVFPYTFNSPLPGTPALNPVSGEISYSASLSQAGYYATVTRVDAFKCGQKIAEIHRDIQAVLIACSSMPGGTQPNDPPQVPIPVGAQTWIIDPAGSSLLDSYETTVTAGTLVTFDILGIDTNLYNGITPQDLTMEISGGQILDPITGTCSNPPCANFTSTSGSPPPIISPTNVLGQFEWQTTCDHVSFDVACGRTTNLYQFSVKVYDDFCPAPAIRNVTLMVYIEADNQMQVSQVQPTCFGNDGILVIEPSLSITQIAWDAELFDMLGNLVASSYNILGNSCTLTNLSDGQYIIRASGAGGCIVQDSVVLLLAPNPLNMQTNISHVSCYGGSDGEIGVYLDNGLLPYTFYLNGVENINPPPYDSLFMGLSEGVYIITGIDTDSCGLRDTVYINAPTFPLQVLSSDSAIVCDTSLGGSAYAYAAGGSPYSDGSYLFEWYNSTNDSIGTGDSISNLAIGDYFLEVTDSNGCQENIPITVSTPALPLSVVSAQLFGVVCTDDSTGSAVVFAGGGSSPYDYAWSDFNGNILATATNIISSDTLSELVSGSYNLLMTDASGCTEDITFIIDEPAVRLQIASVLVVDSIDCFGDLDGRAKVYMVNGSGSPAYSYLWDNGETDSVANSLSGGWHSVWVSDTRGCVVKDSVDVPENDEIKTTLSVLDSISCYGDNDGAIEVIITLGGVPLSTSPYYDYFWSNGVSLNFNTIDNLNHGSYYLTTRDSLGCVVSDSIYLPQPDPLYVNAQEVLRVSCYGDSTGSAFAVGVGGTNPYTFYWQNNNIYSNNSDTVTTLFAGVETVEITDSRGCTSTDTVMINQPLLLEVSIPFSVSAYCIGVSTASATASVVGGTAPYVYVWDDNALVPQTTITSSNLDAGIYTITVTDERGCLASESIDLSLVTSTMSLSITSHPDTSLSCYGDSIGLLFVDVGYGASGPPAGSSPYIYDWVGPTGTSTNDTIFDLSEGIYSVMVTDGNGCVVNTNQQLTAPEPLLYKVLSTSNTTCLGSCDGWINLDIVGGVGPYTADLLNNQNGITSTYSVDSTYYVFDVCTGDYTVTIKDANDCDATLILGGTDQAVLDTTITTDVAGSVAQYVDCYGASTGEVYVVLPQTNPLYSYTWLDVNGDTVGTTITVDSLLAGDYTLYAGYNNITGCTTVDIVTVSQSSLIHSNAIITNTSCNGDSDGSIVAATLGGVAPYVYSWSPISSLTDSLLDSVMAGIYNLTITDFTGCSVLETHTVMEPALLVATVSTSQTYILNALVVGGTPQYSYSWEELTQPTIALGVFENYTVGSYGTYYVVVTDANGCESESNTIVYNEGPLGTIDSNKEIYLSVYPNPFREETTVDFGQRINKSTIRIVDVYGKLIEIHEIADTDKYIIRRTNKASGVYFMEIEINEEYVKNIKLVIE